MSALAVVLLGLGITGAIARPLGLPAWSVPAVSAAVAVVLGLVPLGDARDTVGALTSPVLFLLTAIPLAVLLDELGFFSRLAERIVAAGHGSGALWALAAVVTTVLNLDAAVVLLTPLYVDTARRTGRDPLVLAFQPVLLACLASSALPVSNLTNLIVAEHTGASTTDFLAHLGLPSLVATTVGWWCYRRALRPDVVTTPTVDLAARHVHPRALSIGASVVAVIVPGFVLGPLYGVEPWMVAGAATIVLAMVLGRVPWRHVPYHTALVVVSLAVLAAGAVAAVPVSRVLGGDSLAAQARTVAVAATAANAINNLPALLVGLPAVGSRPSPAVWALLAGVNMGPVVLATGSLASLLWLDSLHRLGVRARPWDFTRVGVRVGLPAAAAGAATLLALAALR